MKNVVKNAPKNSAKNSVKNVADILTNTKSGMAVNLPENVTGEKVKKARELGEIMKEKISANNAEKSKRATLTYNLNALKGNAEKYVQLLALEHKVKIGTDELIKVLQKPKFILEYLSEKQRAKYDTGNLKFNYWLILTLVSKYIKGKNA